MKPLSDLYAQFAASDPERVSDMGRMYVVNAKNNNYADIASFTHGARLEASRRSAVDLAVGEILEIAPVFAKQCANAGYYGQLKIAPGECTCAVCKLKEALAQLRLALEGEK